LCWSFALFSVVLIWLVFDLDRPGVTWDEPEYFASAERIQSWVAELVRDPAAALQPESIVAAWDPPEHDYFNPHPPVYKEGMALTEALFGDLLGPVAGFRLSPAILFAILVGSLVWVVSGVAGIPAGVAAGLSLVLMPRVFGHAHFGATDMPLTVFWALATLSFAACLRSGSRSGFFVAAVALAFALGTKFTGWLLPIPLLIWAILERKWWPWFVLVPVSLAIWYVVVPPSWHDPLDFVAHLVAESLSRDVTAPMTTYYLGTMHPYEVPWHQSLVMMLVTVPVGILALSFVGALLALGSLKIRRPESPKVGLARLSVLNIGFFLVLMGLPSSPNHDGVRLFLPLFPFVAVLAGLGFGLLLTEAQRTLSDRAQLLAVLSIGSLYFLPAWWQTTHTAPYYLSYYNELIGGLPGAERAGMDVSYWYDAMTPAFLARVERELPENAKVLTWPTWKYFEELQSLGRFRSDIEISREWPSPYLLMLARKSTLRSPNALLFPPFDAIYENVQPVLAAELDGVELAGLYVWSTTPDSSSSVPEGGVN